MVKDLQEFVDEIKKNQESSDIVLNDTVNRLDEHSLRLKQIESTEIENKLNDISKELVRKAVVDLVHPSL